jgi:hypothetical protein
MDERTEKDMNDFDIDQLLAASNPVRAKVEVRDLDAMLSRVMRTRVDVGSRRVKSGLLTALWMRVAVVMAGAGAAIGTGIVVLAGSSTPGFLNIVGTATQLPAASGAMMVTPTYHYVNAGLSTAVGTGQTYVLHSPASTSTEVRRIAQALGMRSVMLSGNNEGVWTAQSNNMVLTYTQGGSNGPATWSATRIRSDARSTTPASSVGPVKTTTDLANAQMTRLNAALGEESGEVTTLRSAKSETVSAVLIVAGLPSTLSLDFTMTTSGVVTGANGVAFTTTPGPVLAGTSAVSSMGQIIRDQNVLGQMTTALHWCVVCQSRSATSPSTNEGAGRALGPTPGQQVVTLSSATEQYGLFETVKGTALVIPLWLYQGRINGPDGYAVSVRALGIAPSSVHLSWQTVRPLHY